MLVLRIKVVPKSSADRIAGWVGDRLKVQVTAAPERGKANDAVVELLASTLGVPRRAVRISAGATSPLKTVEVDAGEEARAKLPVRP
jgi:uncharacterized protein (TIGR00251 family)